VTAAALVVLAVAAAVPLLAVLRARPQRGVLLLAALVPFDGLLVLVPHAAFVEGWKEALTLLVLAATALAPASARGAPGRTPPQWLLPVGALLVLGLVSAVLVGGARGVQGAKIGYFYLLLTWALWRCPLDGRERDRLVSVLMATGAVCAVVGLVQQVVGPDALVALGYRWNQEVRSTGDLLRSFSTFNQPFPFGLYLMAVLLVALPVALAAPRRPRNAVFLAAAPVVAAGLLASTVRSAMLGLGVGLVFLGVHRFRHLAHLLPPVAVGLLLVPASVYSAVLSSDSLGDRTSGWDGMVGVVTSSPFGIGVGATGSAAEAATAAGGTGTLFSPLWDAGYQPDDYYVKMLLELGPLGLLLIVLVLVGAFAGARAAARDATDPADAALATGIAASVLGAAAASFVATYFEIFPMEVVFWLLLGVLATLPTRPAPVPAPAGPGAAAPAPAVSGP
jgi:hypothetical protein